MKQSDRPYSNHNMVMRYCRAIDANVVVMRDDDLEPDEYECLTPQRCGGSCECRRRRTNAVGNVPYGFERHEPD